MVRIDPGALCESSWIGSGTVVERGVYIDACAAIGRNCRIGEGAILGAATVGDRVTIEPGVVVLGPVRIGADARICAGLTVTEDVPEGTVVLG